MDRFNLTGKHIAVTGASSGFGHHFAGILAGAGTQVSLGARRTERIDGRVKEIQAQVQSPPPHRAGYNVLRRRR